MAFNVLAQGQLKYTNQHRGYAVVRLSPVIKAVGVTNIPPTRGNACNSDLRSRRSELQAFPHVIEAVGVTSILCAFIFNSNLRQIIGSFLALRWGFRFYESVSKIFPHDWIIVWPNFVRLSIRQTLFVWHIQPVWNMKVVYIEQGTVLNLYSVR